MERSADWMDQAHGDSEHARHDLTAGFHNWACVSAHQVLEFVKNHVIRGLPAHFFMQSDN